MRVLPPAPWLLRFYSASQALLPQCTDAQLATLVVSVYKLLQLRQPDPGSGTVGHVQEQEQHMQDNPGMQQQEAGTASYTRQHEPEQQEKDAEVVMQPLVQRVQRVPPALWQLQLELQLRARSRQRREQQQQRSADAGPPKQQMEQQEQEHSGEAGAERGPSAGRHTQPLVVVGSVLRRWRHWSSISFQ